MICLLAVSLENVYTDVSDLEKNMEMVRKECDMKAKDRSGSQNLNILKDFLVNSEDKLKRLRADTKVAQDAFKECVEYFGESPRMTDANTFFSLLVRFTRSFKVSYCLARNIPESHIRSNKVIFQQKKSLILIIFSDSTITTPHSPPPSDRYHKIERC